MNRATNLAHLLPSLLAAGLLVACPGEPVQPDVDAGPAPDGGPSAARTVLVRGVVVDVAGAAVTGAVVSLGSDTARTGTDGRFALWTVPTAPPTLEVRAEGFAPAERRVHLDAVRVAVAPVTLVSLAASAQVDGAAGGTVEGDGVTVVVPAGAFAGTVTFEVGRIPLGDPLLDDDRLPAPLPRAGRVAPAPLVALILEAEGLQPQAPLQVTATGAAALPPGTQVPVGRYDVDTGAWVDAGVAVADASGALAFQVDHLSSFAAVLPAVPGEDVMAPPIDTLTRAPSVFPEGDPRVDPRTGALQVGVELPALVRRDREIGLVLFHDSRTAKPGLSVPVTIPGAVPNENLLVKVRTPIESRALELRSASPVGADTPPVVLTQLDRPEPPPRIGQESPPAEDLTGTHDVRLTVMRPAEAVLHESATGSFTRLEPAQPILDQGGQPVSAPAPVGVGKTETRPIAVDDRSSSGFGLGWHLAGLTRLVEPECPPGQVTLVGEIDVPAKTFGSPGELYVEELNEALIEGGVDESALNAPLAIGQLAGAVYLALEGPNGPEVWRVVVQTGAVGKVAGGGTTRGCEGLATDLQFATIVGLEPDPSGEGLLLASEDCVMRLDADGKATPVFGGGSVQPGRGVAADQADFGEELRGFAAGSAGLSYVDTWLWGPFLVRDGILEPLRTRVSHPHGPLVAISPDGEVIYGAPEALCLFRYQDGINDAELFPKCRDGLPDAQQDGSEGEVRHGFVGPLAFDSAGRLWLYDGTFETLRRLEDGILTTVAGPGRALEGFGSPPEGTGMGGPAKDAAIAPVGYLGPGDGKQVAVAGPGRVLHLAPAPDGEMKSVSAGDGSALSRLDDGTWERVLADGSLERYDERGLLVSRGRRGEPPLTYHYADWDAPSDLPLCGHPQRPPPLERISLSGEDLFTFEWTGGRLEAITDAAHRRTRLSWSADRRLEQIAAPGASAVRFEYDEDSRVTARREAGPDGSEVSWTYGYTEGRVTTVEVPGRGTRTFEAAEAQGTVTSDDVSVAGVARGLVAGPAVATVPTRTGAAAKVTLKSDGLTVVNPDGGETDLDTDELGRLTRTVDPDGTEWRMTRDRFGRLVELMNVSARELWRYTYDGDTDRIRSRTDPAGRGTRFEYVNGRLQRRLDPFGTITTFEYQAGGAAEGLPTAITDAEGRRVELGYDTHGNRIRQVAPDGAVTQIERDAVGRPVRITEPSGLVHVIDYDARGQETRHQLGESAGAPVLTQTRVATTAWTASGTHVPASAVLSATGPVGGAWRFDRDDDWSPVTLVHPAEGTTEQAFDADGRRTSRTLADGSTERFEWTEGRLTRRYWLGPAAGLETRFEHDDEGRVTSLTDPLRAETRTFEPGIGWTRLVLAPRGDAPAAAAFTLTRTRVTYDVERRTLGGVTFVVTRGWDRGVESVDLSLDGNPVRVLTVARDAARKVTRIERGNGLATVRTYDAAGRVESQAEPGLTLAWTFDEAGRPATRTAGGVERAYAYDDLGRLASCSDTGEQYAWDGAGARTSAAGVSWTRDAGGRLASDGTHDFTYDALGRRTAQDLDAGRRTFVWGAGGFLSEVREGATGSETLLASYGWDGSGRRVRRTTAAGDWLYGYAPDSDRLVRLVEPDGTEWHLFHALPGSAAFTVAATADGRVRYLHVDPLQQVVGVSDETGAFERVVTGCFGQVLEEPALGGPWAAFHGMTYDPETGLYVAGPRLYDPQTGEFLSVDPAGLEGGPAPYPYAGGNPVIAVDPGGRLLGIALGALAVGALIAKGIHDFAQSAEVKRSRKSKQDLDDFDLDDDDVLESATDHHKNFHKAADKGGDTAIKSVKSAVDAVTNPSELVDVVKDELSNQTKEAVQEAMEGAAGDDEE